MKTKPGYLLRKVAGQHVVVPTGAAAVDFNGIITLNGSGALLWETLAKGASRAELILMLLETYVVEPETAAQDVEDFLTKLRENELLLDE